jgi:maltooligosyltrehalose trehalohydrolase
VRSSERGGFDLDAQWNDDFHHSLHALLTGERTTYYEDFGEIRHLAKALALGFVYDGQYSAFRKRKHGSPSQEIPSHALVVCAQNHDQVGNRALGERLSQLTSFQGLKLAGGTTLLSPYIPLIFMGEEYGETAPFSYFISHGDANLVAAVRQGRRLEFPSISSASSAQLPDPQAIETFEQSRLNRQLRRKGEHERLLNFYQEVIRLRKQLAPLRNLDKESMEVQGFETQKVLYFRRWSGESQCFVVVSFGGSPVEVLLPLPKGQWVKVLDSEDQRFRLEVLPQEVGHPLPNSILSGGEMLLTVAPMRLTLFELQHSPTNALRQRGNGE